MSEKTKRKTLGILGGMGPESTVLFFQRIVELTPASSDQDHIPIIIYNQPQIPDRTKAILDQGESPLPALLAGIDFLQKSGVNFICIPCNTAHHYYGEMLEIATVPIVSLIDTVVQQSLLIPRLQRIGLLATVGTIKARIYENAFRRHNVEVVIPEEWEFNDLQALIGRLKSQERNADVMQRMAEALARKQIEGIILGCTELSLLAPQLRLDIPIIDSTEVFARRAVQIATGKEST
jgi:aspartate racemase